MPLEQAPAHGGGDGGGGGGGGGDDGGGDGGGGDSGGESESTVEWEDSPEGEYVGVYQYHSSRVPGCWARRISRSR